MQLTCTKRNSTVCINDGWELMEMFLPLLSYQWNRKQSHLGKSWGVGSVG